MCRDRATAPGIRPCVDESSSTGDAAGVGASRTADEGTRSRVGWRQREFEKRRKRYAEDHDYREKMLARGRARYQAKKDEINERRRRKYADDSKRGAARRASEAEYHRHIRRTYGLSLEEFGALFVRQGGVCAICRRQPKGHLCVDHCHLTGRVRGLLCRGCNMVLGLYRDDPSLMRAATAYLERAPGAALTRSQQGMELNMTTDDTPPDGGKADRLIRHALIAALHRQRESRSQKLRLIADQLVDKAVEGDMQAIKEILDRVDGRPGAAATAEEGPRKVTFAWKNYQYPWTTSPDDNSSPSTSDGSASPAS